MGEREEGPVVFWQRGRRRVDWTFVLFIASAAAGVVIAIVVAASPRFAP